MRLILKHRLCLPIGIFCLFLSLIPCVSANTATWSGKCVGIADGDTITVMNEFRPVKIRLYGIDCPEKKQAFGGKAKDLTADFVFEKVVRVVETGQDRYGRTIALIYVGDLCLNKELLRAGLAWHYKHYSKEVEFAELENEARALRVGLWREKEPVPPWEFRKRR